jgi:hypothetical protein
MKYGKKNLLAAGRVADVIQTRKIWDNGSASSVVIIHLADENITKREKKKQDFPVA